MSSPPKIAVIGGGWSGLAAAVHLAQNRYPVTLFESARQLGGRARCVPFDSLRVDNGQHLMIGAYHAMLQLIDILGIREERVFKRQPMDMQLWNQHKRQFRLRAYPLPAPLHLLLGVIRARGFNLVDRASLLRFSARLARGKILLDRDISVQALLIAEKQTSRLIHSLWEPLCLATLNTRIQEASAGIFLNVLREAFTGTVEDSDFLIPVTDLGSVIPQPAMDFIERHKGDVHLSRRIDSIKVMQDQRLRLQWEKGEAMFDHVILATSPTISQRMLATLDPAIAFPQNLPEEPICTLYLQFPSEVRLPRPVLGFVDHISQWVFDRRLCGQPGLMAVVISGQGEHMALDNEHLTRRVIDELQTHFQDWPYPEKTLVVREKRATFHAGVGVNQQRPPHITSIPGLWLAGDIVNNGLPATLEGAVRNGQRCAEAIHALCLGKLRGEAV